MNGPRKLNIANIPTPLQSVLFKGTKFLMKRDDFTGTELSGNKIRKLEYLLFDAKRKKSNYIFTCGGDQSNHCRATVIAANQVGIKTRLFLWGSDKRNAEGNLFLDKIAGAEIKYLSRKEYKHVNKIMLDEKLKMKKQKKEAYIIPSGGSTPLGIWGYINFMNELKKQTNLKKISGILSADGSGGTSAGMLLGAALLKLNLKIFGVNVVEDSDTSRNIIIDLVEGCIEKYKLKVKVNYNKLEIMDGYSAEGYKSIASNKIDLINNLFRETGILLDPAYTGKAFYAFHENFLKGKRKSNVMFLHTGGIFGVYSKRSNYLGL